MDPSPHSQTTACPHCGHANAGNAKFCNNCGRRIAGPCPHCAAENPPGSRFCNSCGRSLADRPSDTPQSTGETTPAPVPTPEAPEDGNGGPMAACPRCQARNEPDSLYCYNCGLPLQGEPGFRGGPRPGHAGIPAFALGEPGGFWIRLIAYIVDGIVLTGALAILAPVFLGTDLISYFDEVFEGNVRYFDTLLQVAYFGLAVALFATTVGKRLFRLYVVQVDGSRVGFGRSIARASLQLLSGFLFFIGYLIIAFRADKRGLHDLIAGTVVVRRP